MRQTLEKFFMRCGQELTVVRGEQILQVRAFFRPDRRETESREVPLGRVPEPEQTYIGPVRPELQPGDEIRWDGQSWRVCRAELVTGIRGPVYCRARCCRKGREEVWKN